uniref:Uncharacterized protein n=1 Tax=Cucumis melo TaxID=3656 RepID=A0A9I9EGT9_CUCME
MKGKKRKEKGTKSLTRFFLLHKTFIPKSFCTIFSRPRKKRRAISVCRLQSSRASPRSLLHLVELNQTNINCYVFPQSIGAINETIFTPIHDI